MDWAAFPFLLSPGSRGRKGGLRVGWQNGRQHKENGNVSAPRAARPPSVKNYLQLNNRSHKIHRLWSQIDLGVNPGSSFIYCLASGKLFDLSKFQFSYPQNGYDVSILCREIVWLKEVKCLAPCLGQYWHFKTASSFMPSPHPQQACNKRILRSAHCTRPGVHQAQMKKTGPLFSRTWHCSQGSR